MDFRKIILASMESKSITRYRLSKDTGIPSSTLRDWLSGRSLGMTSQHLEKVLEYLKIEISPKGGK